MANSIATAYVQVVPSTEGIRGKLTSAFGNEGTSAGSSFGSSLIGKVKAMIITAGLGKMLGDALISGADLQQSLGGIETLFKDSADIVVKNAEQAYKTAGMSANSYMENVTSFSASLLQSLSGDTQKAASIADMAMTDMSDNANKMGTDMEAIQNAYQGFAKQNYTMLDNLKLGYGGTKTEMERLLADAQKLTGVTYDIDNLADVYEAIHVVQEEIGITGTTALEASSTITGSFASMKAAFSDVLGNLALGRDLGPSLQALSETTVTFLTDNLTPAVMNIVTALPGAAFSFVKGVLPSNLKSTVSTLVTQLTQFISAKLPDILRNGEELIGSLVSGFVDGVPDLLDAASEMLGDFLSTVIAALPSITESGLNIVVKLASGFLANVPSFLSAAADLIKQLLRAFAAALPEMLKSGASLVHNLVSGLINKVPEVISSAARIIAELLTTIASHLPDMLEQGISLIGKLAAGLIAAIPDAVAAIPRIISGIVGAFVGHDWGSIGSSIVSGIAKGIVNAIGFIKDAATSLVNSTKKFLRNDYEINSPSKLMSREVGPAIPEGIADGAVKNTKPLQDMASDLTGITTDRLQANLSLSSSALVAPMPGQSYGDIHNTIYVYGAEGQSMEELVDILEERMLTRVVKKEAALT